LTSNSDARLARKTNSSLGVIFLDLDDFKRVNDTLGHAVGDLLLKEVAVRLRENIRNRKIPDSAHVPDAIVARMGGDEFIILVSSIVGVNDAITVAERILDVLSEPYTIAGNDIFTSPSIGISMFPNDGLTAEDLLRNADMAMYSAKRGGKQLYKVHSGAMDEAAQRRFKVDVCLRSALEREEFEVFFQPKLDLNNGMISSAEALIRWNNEELGFVSPDEFIPIAEDNGLIVPMGEWVLKTACEQTQHWIKSGFAINKVAVNISALQFVRPEFLSVIKKILAETGLPAAHLELEITESLLAGDTSGAVTRLEELKKIGVELSIDDFGTGYSSLSQLKNFPIDRLKIDKSFISGVTHSEDDAAITDAVIAMSESMRIKVLAEGVETQEQLEFLRQNGCDEVQGYLISRPQPASEITANFPSINSMLKPMFSGRESGLLKTGT
jgi:diguanylate cyclase (GGDEF)-like protein